MSSLETGHGVRTEMRPKMVRTFCSVSLIATTPALAMGPEDPILEATRAAVSRGVARAALDCPQASDGTIVVCGRRLPPPRLDPSDRPTTMRPDSKMTGLGSPPIPLRQPSVTFAICFLQKCPKKLYFFDISALPEPPPGSDADKISRGEMRAP
jgi:hypothetical protein